MATPGKLDKSKWEQPAAAAASGGAAVASGAKGMASKFEQAAKDAAPPTVVKKVPWSTTCRCVCVCVCGYVLLIRVRVYALSRSRGRHRARAAVSRMRASTSRRPSSATAPRRPSRLLTCPEHLPSWSHRMCITNRTHYAVMPRIQASWEPIYLSHGRTSIKTTWMLERSTTRAFIHSLIQSISRALAHVLVAKYLTFIHSFVHSTS